MKWLTTEREDQIGEKKEGYKFGKSGNFGRDVVVLGYFRVPVKLLLDLIRFLRQ